MGQIERIVDDYLAREDRSRSWFARQMGLSDKTLSSWFRRERHSPLPAGALKAISRVTTVPYRTVLDAALADSGYLPASSVVDIRDAADGPVAVDDEAVKLQVDPSEEARRRSPQKPADQSD